jgi:hypothetical protein
LQPSSDEEEAFVMMDNAVMKVLKKMREEGEEEDANQNEEID